MRGQGVGLRGCACLFILRVQRAAVVKRVRFRGCHMQELIGGNTLSAVAGKQDWMSGQRAQAGALWTFCYHVWTDWLSH